ncbi:hypothetical protein PsYK624_164320 [Phanerochaete sordida]|uniref:Uncharacterized protein n=1 Tax=Phanerochaete sordida TaxID=48140 RepID=A0A9P3LNH8_9APHY|nr:hypothetical protein PsYK624_164320 [Phanerochaete sordida]
MSIRGRRGRWWQDRLRRRSLNVPRACQRQLRERDRDHAVLFHLALSGAHPTDSLLECGLRSSVVEITIASVDLLVRRKVQILADVHRRHPHTLNGKHAGLQLFQDLGGGVLRDPLQQLFLRVFVASRYLKTSTQYVLDLVDGEFTDVSCLARLQVIGLQLPSIRPPPARRARSLSPRWSKSKKKIALLDSI